MKNKGLLDLNVHSTNKISRPLHKRFCSFPAAKMHYGLADGWSEKLKPIIPLNFSEFGGKKLKMGSNKRKSSYTRVKSALQ